MHQIMLMQFIEEYISALEEEEEDDEKKGKSQGFQV